MRIKMSSRRRRRALDEPMKTQALQVREIVSDVFGIQVSQWLSGTNSKRAQMVACRITYAMILYSLHGFSLTQIQDAWGFRYLTCHHSTVINSLKEGSNYLEFGGYFKWAMIESARRACEEVGVPIDYVLKSLYTTETHKKGLLI